jgi:pyoverdine/dityrosine biosynthesis protein Dit1
MVYKSRFIIPALPNKFAQAVTLLLCVPDVSGSHLSLQKFSSFSQAVQATADVMP